MAAVRVRPLECGRLRTDQGTLLSGRVGDWEVPVGAFLVEHERGTAVFDTGMHPELMTDTSRLGLSDMLFEVDLGADGLLGARLRAAGVDPAEVDLAVLSHLHFDHAGGLVEVPEARAVVQREEWAAGEDPVLIELGVYQPDDFRTGHDVELVDGRHDLFGDGSVVAVPTPGHTAGHQSLLVEGRMLLVGDACYCRLALDEEVLPPVAADPDRQLAGFRWLREQEAAGVRLVFSHDPDQWPTLGAEL